MYKKKLKDPVYINIQKYKVYRNKLTNIIRMAERNYYTHLLESHKHNMRKSWDVIKDIIGRKKKRVKKKIVFTINDTEIDDN